MLFLSDLEERKRKKEEDEEEGLGKRASHAWTLPPG